MTPEWIAGFLTGAAMVMFNVTIAPMLANWLANRRSRQRVHGGR